MRNWKAHVAIALVLIAVTVILGSIFAKPVWAQVRAALVRDVDSPALAPVSASVSFFVPSGADYRQMLVVPSGKRFVLEYVSYEISGSSDGQLVYAVIEKGTGDDMVYLEIHPPHPSLLNSFTIQEGGQLVRAYFEAGEEVRVFASNNGASSRLMSVRISGHYITP